jgi:hypothetical protein
MNANTHRVELRKLSEYKVCLSGLAFFEKYTTANVPKCCMLTFEGTTLKNADLHGFDIRAFIGFGSRDFSILILVSGLH